MKQKLPPLPEEAFEYGYKEKVDIKFNKCKHDPVIISGTELKCKKCGNGWMGDNILQLKKLLDSV
jgi:hypothetical protein